MLNEITGDVWEIAEKGDALCILTNNSIYDGKNPMGGGIAYEALRRNPNIDEVVAKAIKKNIMFIAEDAQSGIVLLRFPTKHEISDMYSDIELVKSSLSSLHLFAKLNSGVKIYLPRPGCGIGGLDWETEVKSLCEEKLGDCSNVYIVSK